MRKMLPIILLLAGIGCSIPRRHDPNLVKKPAIPLVEEAPAGQPLSEGSLWRDRPYLADLRAFRVNDLVTLRISESTNAIKDGKIVYDLNGHIITNAHVVNDSPAITVRLWRVPPVVATPADDDSATKLIEKKARVLL